MKCETTATDVMRKQNYHFLMSFYYFPVLELVHIVFDKMEATEKTRRAHLSLESLNTTRKKNKEETLIYLFF